MVAVSNYKAKGRHTVVELVLKSIGNGLLSNGITLGSEMIDKINYDG